MYYEDYRASLQAENPLDVPDLLILDTRERVAPILKTIQHIPGLEWDDTDAIQTVLQCIQYENTAMSDLQDKCWQIVAQATGHQAAYQTHSGPAAGLYAIAQMGERVTEANSQMQLAQLLFELGSQLYAMLRGLGCYTSGYLFYQFKDWVGLDMRLVRFEVDTESLR